MSEIVDLAIKQGEEMYKLGRKHEALEIKAEIEKEYPCTRASNPKDNMISYGIHIALEIINKRISVLEGE